MPEENTPGAMPETAVPEATPAAPEPGAMPEPVEPAKAQTPDELQAELERTREALKKANKEAEQRRRKLEELDAAEAKRKEAEMSELEKANKRAEEAEKRAAQIERERLLDRIAAKHSLPEDLRDRLRGESEEDLEEDAQKLAALVVKSAAPQVPNAPDLDADRRGGLRLGELTDDKKRELASRYRIPVQ